MKLGLDCCCEALKGRRENFRPANLSLMRGNNQSHGAQSALEGRGGSGGGGHNLDVLLL